MSLVFFYVVVSQGEKINDNRSLVIHTRSKKKKRKPNIFKSDRKWFSLVGYR